MRVPRFPAEARPQWLEIDLQKLSQVKLVRVKWWGAGARKWGAFFFLGFFFSFACTWGMFLGFYPASLLLLLFCGFLAFATFGFGGFLASAAFWLLRLFGFGGFSASCCQLLSGGSCNL